MATITKQFGSGGANLVPGGSGGIPTLADTLRDVADDLAVLRTAQVAANTKLNVLGAKLNADAGVTDTNYAIDFDVAITALKTIKG